jgi:hypothetical protein
MHTSKRTFEIAWGMQHDGILREAARVQKP